MNKHTINHLTVSVALSLVCSGALAHSLYWTGETDNIWSKAANWYNKDTGKVAGSFPGIPNLYDHLAYFDQTLADGVSEIKQRTVVFETAELMRGSVYIYDGTMADPIVFSASDNYGLSITNSAKRFWIGSDDGSKPGWLKMQGGSFSSNPELKINNGGWIVDGGASFSTTNHISVGAIANCNATAVFNDGAITLTKSGNQNCNFIIGNASGAVGVVTNAGATITVGNSLQLGNAASSGAHYVQSGGRLDINNRLTVGGNTSSADNLFELTGGEVVLGQLFLLDNASFLLKGGSVSFTSIGSGGGSKENEFVFDGGTYITKQSQNYAPFPSGNFKSLKVGANGGTIDTATYGITITHAFESGVESGTDGGMKFTGGGSASITGAIDYTGPTTVELGTVVTIADRANIFGEGKGGLCCSLPNPKPEGNEYIPVLTTTGENDFTASDLTKCAAAEGTGAILFKISDGGKSIMAKRSNGLIISFH